MKVGRELTSSRNPSRRRHCFPCFKVSPRTSRRYPTREDLKASSSFVTSTWQGSKYATTRSCGNATTSDCPYKTIGRGFCYSHGYQKQATRPVLCAGNRASVARTVTAHQSFVVASKVLDHPVRQDPRSPDEKQINSANGSAPCASSSVSKGGRVPQVGPQ